MQAITPKYDYRINAYVKEDDAWKVTYALEIMEIRGHYSKAIYTHDIEYKNINEAEAKAKEILNQYIK